MGLINFDPSKMLSCSLSVKPTNDETHAIFVSLACGSSKFSFLGIEFYLSLIVTYLNVSADSGVFPYSTWLNSSRTDWSSEATLEGSSSIGTTDSTALKAGMSLAANANVEFGGEVTASSNHTQSSTISFTQKNERFVPRGDESAPSWKISSLHGETALGGMILLSQMMCKYDGSDSSSILVNIEIPKNGIIAFRENWKNTKNATRDSILSIFARKHARDLIETHAVTQK